MKKNERDLQVRNGKISKTPLLQEQRANWTTHSDSAYVNHLREPVHILYLNTWEKDLEYMPNS